jgi:hypothetical protein
MKRNQLSKRVGRLDYCRFVTALAVIFLSAWAKAHSGPAPLLEFDAPFTASCRSLASTDAAKKHPGRDLVEVKIPITARLVSGTERDIKQCTYTLADPNEPGTLSVLDWLPRTELKTEYAKPIQFNKEGIAKIGINMSAHYIVTTAGDAGGQLKSGVAYELLPPKEIVLASGTVHQGHGVYFKLKPSTQTTLEGMKLFSAICAVPRGWRGGCLKLQCEAVGSDRGVISALDRQIGSGREIFCLALYLEGDVEAEKLANDVATCQQALFDALPDEAARMSSSASWRHRIAGSPWSLTRLSRFGATEVAPTRTELLTYVLDRTTVLTENVPKPLLTKLLNLQLAVEALRACSTKQNTAGTPASPKETQSVDSVPRRDKDKQPVRSQTKAPADQSVAAQKSKAVITVAASGRAANDGNSPANGNTTKSLDSPRKGGEENAAPAASAKNPVVPDQPPQGSTRQIWYIMASLWGAVFTYILAPLVVDILRRRLKERRLRRSKTAPSSLPAAKYGSLIIAVPTTARHARAPLRHEGEALSRTG